MKKIFFLIIISMLLSGCVFSSTPNEESLFANNVEQDIRKGGKERTELNKIDLAFYKDIQFEFDEKEKCLCFIKEGEERLGAIKFNEKDYENFLSNFIKNVPPDISNEVKVSPKLEEKFDTAKKLVKAYIEQSSIILEEDKKIVKKAVSNMKLLGGEFSSEYSEYGMVCFENSIYININADTIEFLNEYVFVHELIHVMNRITSKGSMYEGSLVNNGAMYEGITDLLAVTITLEGGIDCWESVSHSRYTKYYDTVYTLMSNDNFNLLEAYFYPDNYQKLIELTSEEFVKAIFYSLYMLDENGYANSNEICINYYLTL